MIRVHKSASIPASLLVHNCSRYNGNDVRNALVTDQYEKCYLCEQKTNSSFEIDHLKSQAPDYHPELKYIWTNLFLSCGYCNSRKPNDFNLLSPIDDNIEDTITHRLEFETKKANFTRLREGVQENFTVSLLSRLFNGKDKLRKAAEEILYNNLTEQIVSFLTLLNAYKDASTNENRQKVIDSLLITKEFLAFKYWIIKDNGFYEPFKDYMIWNKI